MINLLVSWSLSVACIVFIVSLPLARYEAGAKLRRVALTFLLVGLAPFFFIDLLRTLPTPGQPRVAMPGAGLFEMIGVLAVVSPLAYTLLMLRRRLTHSRRDSHHARLRRSGKVPVDGHRDQFSDNQRSLFDEDLE
ncbi:MAG: hypothetical protein JO093_13695 [Acidobacteria bacterium]|nr:hypothetical protein [Acidobacteriota bacterium]MBV9068519.1 hypothetical protein [Acidobacteriota bacterium]MBV9186667.1 hypothetical protein [Acidobacteriota bacterium]